MGMWYRTVLMTAGVLGGLWAQESTLATPKQTLDSGMRLHYDILPSEVSTFSQMWQEGIFYGRLRMNNFGFKWGEELQADDGRYLRKDHAIAGLGGSFIYKSGYWYGLGVTAGVYGSFGWGSLPDDEAYLYKGGKDTISRYDMLNGDSGALLNIAQAYVAYRYKQGVFRAGRQIFESFLTGSGDSKMVPNTFEGYTYTSDDIANTHIAVAYLLRQKLRDHNTFHHLLARGVSTESDPYGVYSENDDSAMHRGLTLEKLQARGIEDRMFVAEVKNRSIEGLKVWGNYTALPELLSDVMVELDYSMHYEGVRIAPAVRYMYQFDNGAGEIGGANLRTVTAGYVDPDSLESWLFAARIDVGKDAWRVRFGYTQIADKGDIVAPWRGYPTAGFTRAMGQYNWYAATKSYMVRYDHDWKGVPKLGNLHAKMRFVVQDFDDDKPGVQADSQVLTLDLSHRFESYQGLYGRVRLGHVSGDDDTVTPDGVRKLDPSYDEVRFELNYLF